MAESINSPVNCCLIILILLLQQSVWMVFNNMQWSSHHWYASASATLQWSRKNPQTDLVSMLKSKDTFVPCKNLSFGNKLSLIAMEKAAALPLRAGFMPNSPIPMLDVSELLLLMAVSTSAGSLVLPLLPLCILLVVSSRFWLQKVMFSFCLLMVVGLKELCCVVWKCVVKFLLFSISILLVCFV